MGKNLTGKIGFIVAILVIFIYGIFYGLSLPRTGPWTSMKNGNIHLGLDLKGGTHLVMQVHVDESIGEKTDRDMQRLNTDLAATGAKAAKLDPKNTKTIDITGVSPAQTSAVHDVLTGTTYADYDVNTVPNGYQMVMKQSAITATEADTLDRSISTIRTRIDQFGTKEPTIERYGLGENQILLELPGVSDPAEVQRIIETTPKLSIHEVVGQPAADEAGALQALGGSLPVDDEIVHGSGSFGTGSAVYVVKRAAIVQGDDFKSATPSQDPNGRPDINFTLKTDAGDQFYKYTDANKGTGQMAILLNNTALEVATIQSAIRDQGEISGGFTEESAQELSQKLSSGSIPATISYTETRTVGPSLGAQSIHQGVVAAVVGMLAVMIFMLIYYRGAGINADLALALNLVILLGFMGYTHATLTLPGIAGVILTIGMGVDSNVLIFERIREELRLGKSAAAAIQDGFAHAWVTILDTHITTIVSAGILFIFGTGPVRGFATTLVFGLLANLFTAVLVSRVIFDFLLQKRGRQAALSI